MLAEPVLRAAGLGKAFPRGRTVGGTAREILFGGPRGDIFWAVAPLDLEVRPGEAVGIIGRNGSGKSTLLQMLCRTMEPTVGTVRTRGRVAALLALGAGFHYDYTGRENASLNAAVLGLTEAEITARMPAIAAFSDLGDYFDRPVREYSSGMFARLSFAVATHVDADVLVVDEVLAVGDYAFQRKCYAKMREFRARGGALLFVSHSAMTVVSVCERAIWLDGGQVRADGPSDAVNEAYQLDLAGLGDSTGARAENVLPVVARDPRWEGRSEAHIGSFDDNAPWHGHGGARVTDLTFRDLDGRQLVRIRGGDEVEMCIRCHAERAVERPIVGFMFRDAYGQNLFGDNSFLATVRNPPAMASGESVTTIFRFQFPWLPKGEYHVAPSIIEGTQADHIHLHWMENALRIEVTESPVIFGVVGVPMKEISLT
ncbi:MAG: ABC transporter ATP-binding protein [Flavobacteriaceae bacterium]